MDDSLEHQNFLTTMREIEQLMADGKDRTHEEIQQHIGISTEIDDALTVLCEHRHLETHQEQDVGYYRKTRLVAKPPASIKATSYTEL